MIQALEAVLSFQGQGEELLIVVTLSILASILFFVYVANSESDFI